MKATILVRYKKEVPDHAGSVLHERLHTLGYTEVKTAALGKLIELEIESADRGNAQERVRQIASQILANQLTEEFEILSLD
ncbi:phosphoribosylformylglycinamidine synthase subunit PurS [bacterium]|nr:phosphoribosylformylglycinamidine synthase subunit PurS [bacterium]